MISIFDFNLYSDRERVEYIKNELQSKNCPTSTELESMANYILFGKGEDGESQVDKKNIEIETKYKSYSKRKVESLEELTSNPVFDERSLRSLGRSRYTSPKPTLDRTLPELQPLLEEIEKWQHIYDVAIGKEKDLNLRQLTPTEIYKLKHFLIDLKKQQYVISEALSPKRIDFSQPSYSPIYNFDVGIDVRPLGLKIGNCVRFDNPREDKDSNFEIPSNPNSINLEDPTHIYGVLEFYSTLLEESLDKPDSNGKYLIETLDFYIEKTPLDASRKTIVELKKHKVSNQEIKKKLEEPYGLSYNENYISTIYTKEICKKISETVTLHKDYWLERNNPEAWKQCSCCGQWKLRDPREFVRKKSSVDGYVSRCKICDREKRKGVR